MIHTILVTFSPEFSEANRTALLCCESIIAEGGNIKQIFFMHDANYMAIHSRARQWSFFASEHDIALQTCISTAEQKSIELSDYAAGFEQGGLSVLADSILSSDQLVQFNADSTDVDIQSVLKKTNVLKKRKITFIFQSAPEEDSLAAEGVDLLLVLSAFEADISVVFMGEGIQNILNREDVVNHRYTKRFLALEDFGVDQRFLFQNNDQEIQLMDTKISCKKIIESNFLQLVEDSHVLYF